MLYSSMAACHSKVRDNVLIGLQQRFRARAALTCAALYLVCVLVSSVAFALAHGGDLLDCLTEQHAVAAVPHHDVASHELAGMMHDHGGSGAPHQYPGDPQKHQIAPCCSMFAMVALLGAPVPELASATPLAASFPLLQDALDGRGPDRINRPPIA
jgi:hypothetical protein